MAILAQDDKQNVNGQQDQSAQSGQSSGGGVNFAGAGGGFSTNPSNSAGVGSGGTQGWTNIQSYLTANKDNTGSQDSLKNTVGSEFDKEQKNLDDSSSKAKSDAQSEVDKYKIGQDQASQMITDMGSRYNYSGKQDDTYNGYQNQFQNSLNATYGGPQSYSYGMGQKAQDYGSSLGNDQGFDTMMSGIYNQAAGGALNQGSLDLQHALDRNNQGLQNTRQNLLQQYAGLQGNVTNTVQNTDAAVKQAQRDFSGNQSALRSYLLGQRDTEKGLMDSELDRATRRKNQVLGMYQDGDVRQLVHDNVYGNLHHAYTYNGNNPTLENLRAVDTDRGRYNAIADALMQGGKIGYDANDYGPGSISDHITGRADDGAAVDWNKIYNYGEPVSYDPAPRRGVS